MELNCVIKVARQHHIDLTGLCVMGTGPSRVGIKYNKGACPTSPSSKIYMLTKRVKAIWDKEFNLNLWF